MKRYIFKVFLLVVSGILVSTSCVRENFPDGGGLQDGEGWLCLDFGTAPTTEVHTKYALDYSFENAVTNVYVFLFDASGNKIYGNWLTADMLLGSRDEVLAASDDCWYVNNSSSTGTKTTGTIKIKASNGTGLQLYLLTNLDADMVRLSSDLLAHNVSKKQDLLDFEVYMNVQSVNRNKTFVMTGMADGLEINGNNFQKGGSNVNISLKRLDSKVKVVFKTGSRPDANGQKITSFTPDKWRVVNVPVTSYAIEKTTDSGNVPDDGELTNEEYVQYAPLFFDSPWSSFEEISSGESSFTFYMLENRQKPKKVPTSYHDRSREVKTDAGKNDFVNVEYVDHLGKPLSKKIKKFVNANDFSTYLQVSGRVDMKLENDDAGQTLGADVQYIIHLGDWSVHFDNTGTDNATGGKDYDDEYTGIDNFNTERNTFYTYTVTVNSVNNIRVEVESSRDSEPGDIENQPGAIGEVVIAKEEIALCDAHYVSKTMSFHAENFILRNTDGTYESTADRLTWRVKTPFNPEGASPEIVDGEEIATGIDYKWVRFRLNKMDDMGNYFSDQRRKYNPDPYEERAIYTENTEKDGTQGLAGYHNDGSMDIIFLVKWIKQQVALYVDYLNNGGENKSLFDEGGTDDNGDGTPDGPKISVTAFVDEFYYDKNPKNDKVYPELWKEFVNTPDRYMHILCDSNSSTDNESTSTGSVITIQQKSIKSIYNTDPAYTALTTAWGTESVDEFSDKIGFYNPGETATSGVAWNPNYSGNNRDEFNGRANSVCEWGLVDKSATQATDITAKGDDAKWSKFIDLEVDNDTPELASGYESLRYMCMTRNRDNNGDGQITRDEIRWYTAANKQLVGIFVGQRLLETSAKLYYRTAEEQGRSVHIGTFGEPGFQNGYKQLVISSTRSGVNEGNIDSPTVFWTHEGLSTSNYHQSMDWEKGTPYGVRCVRNLGLEEDAAFNVAPDDYVECTEKTGPEGTYYEFLCTHLNAEALRDPNSGELAWHNHLHPLNSLYKKFETAPTKITKDSEGHKHINEAIDATVDKSSVTAGYCPTGYRLPNQVELVMMKLYNAGVSPSPTSGINIDYNNQCRTYWAFGPKGVGHNTNPSNYGFMYIWTGNITTADSYGSTSTRCVRDIRVE